MKTAMVDGIAVIDVGDRKLVGEHDDYDLWGEVEKLLAK